MSSKPEDHLPGFYCNRFAIVLNGDLARIIFSEMPFGSQEDQPRAAIVLRLADFVELGTLIEQLNKKHAEAMAAGRATVN